MAKWDLSKLPEGRKPLPDEWFRERAHMQERIAELEDKLAKAVELALDECPFRWGTPSHEDWWHHRRTTLAELKGQSDE